MRILEKITLVLHILHNMGWRYFSFRVGYELKRKSGLLQREYPVNPPAKSYISLEEWKKRPVSFFFKDKSELQIKQPESDQLAQDYQKFQSGKLHYFNSLWLDKADWLVNPDSGHRYDPAQHWTQVEDFSATAGDIKFVWERSRFSWVYTLIRHKQHTGQDCAEQVFTEIDSWITANPINQGPNYKCSQEISLRTLNWTFALYYYRNSPALTEARFQRILHVIYWQLRHVRSNINFSRIAVRNNHAITETLMLYLGGLLFPFFPEAKHWKQVGKQWFEEEIAYQVYEDGTFLQFSHNYHRVVIQLFTWAFHLARANGETFSPTTYERAYRSVEFLYQCQSDKNGQLPNYGANDGAFFFKLNDCDYRDFRPQLNALHYFLTGQALYRTGAWSEDHQWYGHRMHTALFPALQAKKATASYPVGGFYVLRDGPSMTFVRCGKHKDRPSHADNLHLDLWYDGENILRDAGTYKYNAQPELVQYFTGTAGHNTVTLGQHDQMKKGPRFVWLHWSQAFKAEVKETEGTLEFTGTVSAFEELGKGILHTRTIKKTKGRPQWEVWDEITHQTAEPLVQHWHPANQGAQLSISALDSRGQAIQSKKIEGLYSGYYGQKETAPALTFQTTGSIIRTSLELAAELGTERVTLKSTAQYSNPPKPTTIQP